MYSFRGTVAHLFMRFCSLLPLEDKIVFSCFDGKSYSDNPKAIYEEMQREKIDIKYIWLLRDENIHIKGAKVVKFFSLRALYHLATSKIWIDNSRKRSWTVKRKGQFYIQTWHAGIGLKMAERDASESLPMSYIKDAIHDSKIADLFISGSRWSSNNYRNAYWYDGEILECGLPRSDVFFSDKYLARKKIIDFYNLNNNDYVILYAPTFRSDLSLDYYKMDFEKVLKAAKNKWEGEWKILVRLHPNIQSKNLEIQYSENVLNGSLFSDINIEILASDVLITDYSSCMFDALNIGKKVFLYANDVENFLLNERGLYFKFEELPFSLAKNSNQLIANIEAFDEYNYNKKKQDFLNKQKVFDDGKASERVVMRIKKELGMKENIG